MSSFTVSRTRTGLYLGLCHKCGHVGRYKTEHAAWQAETNHMCTETPEREG